jgi:DNA-binding MarR family transcriptional regulator/ribosomal protein S18 acetylase RimI-like enzyme
MPQVRRKTAPQRPSPDAAVVAVRKFSRFYTRRLRIVGDNYLGSDLSLTEGRVLYELCNREAPSARDIGRDLGLDAAYLSRILARFARRRLIRREPSPDDRRENRIAVTAAGRRLFATLDRRSSDEVGALIATLGSGDRERLVGALNTIESLLGTGDAKNYRLRGPRVGDIGWVIEAHGRIYAQEFGWDERFEALAAEIAAAFVKNFDAARERCWIAEISGLRAGCVFLADAGDGVAKLRLLIVEPWARGSGLGRRLVDEVIGFAKEAGYRKLTLWTQQNLEAARRIYAAAGFRKTHEEPYTGIGRDLVSETWDLDL